MEPATIAAQLRELAIYYELDGDKHRAFAYERAATSVEAANGLHRLIDEGRLEELPGVGASIARTVAELARRGTVAVLERLRVKWPAVVIELAQLRNVGVTRARTIYQTIGPSDLDAVATMCRAGAIAALPGFGKVTEQKLLESIEQRRIEGTRIRLVDAEPSAQSLANHLRASPAVTRVEICGPIRRWSEVVDHLAYLVETSTDAGPDAVIDRLAGYGLVTSVDRSRSSAEAPIVARLADGLRVEIHVAAPGRGGWAQIVATGSVEHVAQLRARASDRSVQVDELADEHAVYSALALPFFPPELRDGSDELAAADAGDRFSDLITLDDITTATHCHTTYSDGRNSILEMAQAAARLGFRAITITDHSAASSYAGGLDLAKLQEQAAELAKLEPPIRILHGSEADILADGAIDVPPEMLPKLDLVIASVHQRFKLDIDAMTQRLVTAMRQPFFKIWGHALGRLVLSRPPIDVRIDEILDAVAESRAAVEINGDPHRLDLDPINARKASARGIRFVLSCDAHSTAGLEAVRFAVGMARRARIRKHQVLNALPPEELAAAVRP